MTLITPHFALEEFGQHARHGLPAMPYPKEWIDDRLLGLCEELEILRRELKAAIMIASGYRSPEYNRKIGGARNSQHVQGRAADIRVYGVNFRVVHDTALSMYKKGLLKISGLGRYPESSPPFVHIDVRIDPDTGKRSTRLARWTGNRHVS